ncbi:hypothetical protein [Paenibacillus thermotolerans]|uniref:hypothetical protein n=1 Tax=Paenibacillus thermotolerans TaxID=3027807 RepID=UPI0023685342|nr:MULTISPECIES: hypothetical protein [unclassified Paenibacillus]
MRAVKHIILWIASMILFIMASLGLELLEGNKITTSEYYGLRNIGLLFVALIILKSTVVYPLMLWPLSRLAQMLANPLLSRIFILVLCSFGGYALFHKSYDEYFVRQYGLNVGTAVILFGMAGIFYLLADYYMERRVNTVDAH